CARVERRFSTHEIGGQSTRNLLANDTFEPALGGQPRCFAREGKPHAQSQRAVVHSLLPLAVDHTVFLVGITKASLHGGGQDASSGFEDGCNTEIFHGCNGREGDHGRASWAAWARVLEPAAAACPTCSQEVFRKGGAPTLIEDAGKPCKHLVRQDF